MDLVGLAALRAPPAAPAMRLVNGSATVFVSVIVVRIPCGSASQCLGYEDKYEDVVSDHRCDANQVDGVEASDGG
jgi:hypothetical protein